MRNQRQWFVYLSLVGCGILLLAYQTNFKAIAPQKEMAQSSMGSDPSPCMMPEMDSQLDEMDSELDERDSQLDEMDSQLDEMDSLLYLVTDSALMADLESAATGHLFTGEKFRTFNEFLFKNEAETQSFASSSLQDVAKKNCEKWGVMTTITSPPTEAIRRFLYKQDWCVVVAADLNKPKVSLFLSNIFN